MKKIVIISILTIQAFTIAYSQHVIEDLYVHYRENIFYLRMPISEVRRLLGNPVEEEKIIREHYHRPNYFIIKYPGIEFTYFDFSHRPEIVPTVLVITFKKPYQLGNLNFIGRNKNEILEHYGTPDSVEEQGEYKYFNYVFNLQMPHHLVLQYRFNSLSICDEVSVIHSNFYI